MSHYTYAEDQPIGTRYDISCHWPALKQQLVNQWPMLDSKELDHTGPNSKRLAALIALRYGLEHQSVQHYLANFSRTMPLH